MLDIVPYKDESLVGCLARAAIRYDVKIENIACLLGVNAKLTENCIGWIGQIAKHSDNLLDTRILLEEHTSFKYLTLLFDERKKLHAADICLYKNGGIKYLIKLCANRYTNLNSVKFCKLCLLDSYHKSGEIVLRNRHQFNFVDVCEIHNTRLLAVHPDNILDLVSGKWIKEKFVLPVEKVTALRSVSDKEQKRLNRWRRQLLDSCPIKIPTRNQRINLIFWLLIERWQRTRQLYWSSIGNEHILKLREVLLSDPVCASESDEKLWDCLPFFLLVLASITNHEDIHELFAKGTNLPDEVAFARNERRMILG